MERFYELLATEQAGALVESPYEPIDPDKCLRAAMSAYVHEYR
ncbi:hypothetical protein ACQ4WX_01230 [Streptomyces lasalocidi]